jgi:hypothetical protein
MAHGAFDPDPAQPFPPSGLLAQHRDLSLQELRDGLADAPEARVYPYVVATIDRLPDGRFAQRGSAPNFQGDLITLCTCKHQLRASSTMRDPHGVWIAGTTRGGLGGPGRHLFYLMFVRDRYESHARMWESLGPRTRDAKAASLHPLGDLYEPLHLDLAGDAQFDIVNYRPPCKGHTHGDGSPPEWHHDVDATYHSGRRPVLLAGDPRRSWLWTRPMIRLREQRPLPRNPASSESVSGFLDRLEPSPRN